MTVTSSISVAALDDCDRGRARGARPCRGANASTEAAKASRVTVEYFTILLDQEKYERRLVCRRGSISEFGLVPLCFSLGSGFWQAASFVSGRYFQEIHADARPRPTDDHTNFNLKRFQLGIWNTTHQSPCTMLFIFWKDEESGRRMDHDSPPRGFPCHTRVVTGSESWIF